MIALAALLAWGSGRRHLRSLVLLAIPLIPIAITVAIVRYQLLDIRLVISRALAWVLLSLAVLVAYVALVALLDHVVAAQLGRSALVTVLLVLVAAPVLPRLQRLVDRAMYGDRDNPARLVGQVGAQLATADAGPGRVVGRDPYGAAAAVRGPAAATGDRAASDGEPPDRACTRGR